MPETIVVRPIGYVRTDVPDEEIRHRRREIRAEIVLDEDLAPALDGIEDFSHLFVLFWLHRVPPEETQRRKVHPRGRTDLPLVGVLATRGRSRPNPIGLAVVELLGRSGSVLQVRGLDAYDGTPVLDIKPYDSYDVVPHPRVPAWWVQLHP
jgi:tRNA-Thr(GGU) m(6)t(6)A37 methyltransferase TsaA